MIFTLLRFNFAQLSFLILLKFIVQLIKMIMLYFKRTIVNLFFDREQNNIKDYNDSMFRVSISKNILYFLLIELIRVLVNHHLKYGQKKLTRKSTSLISLLIYDKFIIQNLLPNYMKEEDLINYFQTDIEAIASFFYK